MIHHEKIEAQTYDSDNPEAGGAFDVVENNGGLFLVIDRSDTVSEHANLYAALAAAHDAAEEFDAERGIPAEREEFAFEAVAFVTVTVRARFEEEAKTRVLEHIGTASKPEPLEIAEGEITLNTDWRDTLSPAITLYGLADGVELPTGKPDAFDRAHQRLNRAKLAFIATPNDDTSRELDEALAAEIAAAQALSRRRDRSRVSKA